MSTPQVGNLPPSAAAAAAAPSTGSLPSASGSQPHTVTHATDTVNSQQANSKPYQWTNNLILSAGVLSILGLVFFSLLSANVLPLKAVVVGGVPSGSAIAFACGVSAIIAFVCRYSCNRNPNDPASATATAATATSPTSAGIGSSSSSAPSAAVPAAAAAGAGSSPAAVIPAAVFNAGGPNKTTN